jgi:hypothetical protein
VQFAAVLNDVNSRVKENVNMKRLFVIGAALTLAVAFAQTPPQLPGRVVAKPGENQLLFLAFKDQAAVDAGHETTPVSVPVNPDGTFVFPPSLPVGVTIATTPPCIDLEAILVRPAPTAGGTKPGDLVRVGATEVNLLDLLKSANAGASSPGYPKLGNVTQIAQKDQSFAWGLFVDKSITTTMVGKGGLSTSTGGGLGYGSLSASFDYSKAVGGVNLGCRNEKKVTVGAK